MDRARLSVAKRQSKEATPEDLPGLAQTANRLLLSGQNTGIPGRSPPPPGVRVRFFWGFGFVQGSETWLNFSHIFHFFFSYCVKPLNPLLHNIVRTGW